MYYPDTLTYERFLQDDTPIKNENGDMVTPEAASDFPVIKCRYETAGAGKTVPNADGQDVIYKAIIYMPRDIDEIKPDTVLTISGRPKSKVIVFSKDAFNCRAWV